MSHFVVNRPVYRNEIVLLHSIIRDLENSREDDTELYCYIDLGQKKIKTAKELINIYTFDPDLILWTQEMLGVTTREAIYCEGAHAGYVFDLNMFLYDNFIGDIKRFVCLTSESIMNSEESMLYPEVFCEHIQHALFYFENIAKLEDIIEVYEEDDRGDYIV